VSDFGREGNSIGNVLVHGIRPRFNYSSSYGRVLEYAESRGKFSLEEKGKGVLDFLQPGCTGCVIYGMV